MLLVKMIITVGVLELLKNLKKVLDIVRYTIKKTASNGLFFQLMLLIRTFRLMY